MPDIDDDEIVKCFLEDKEVNHHTNWEEMLKERIELLRKPPTGRKAPQIDLPSITAE